MLARRTDGLKRRTLFFLAAVLAVGGMGLRGEPLPQPASQPDPTEIAQAIEEALQGRAETFHLDSHCLTSSGLRAVELLSPEVGIWGGDTQILLQPEQLRTILLLLRDSGFALMKESYGGKNDPGPQSNKRPSFASRITCRLEVTVNGVSKQSNQFRLGRQSVELQTLVDSILDTCEQSVATGVTASSMDDALAKLVEGTLRPETLKVIINRKPSPRRLAEGTPGWILIIEGGAAKTRDHLAPRGMSAEVRQAVSPARLKRLAKVLLESRMSQLPVNLFDRHYTDLTVELLGHRKNVQARRFSGLARSSAGKKRFQRVFRELEGLYQELRELRKAGSLS